MDALGNPLRFTLTPGQQHDITQAETLLTGYRSEYVIADKGYDAQDFVDHLAEEGMVAVIPHGPTAKRHGITIDPYTENATS